MAEPHHRCLPQMVTYLDLNNLSPHIIAEGIMAPAEWCRFFEEYQSATREQRIIAFVKIVESKGTSGYALLVNALRRSLDPENFNVHMGHEELLEALDGVSSASGELEEDGLQCSTDSGVEWGSSFQSSTSDAGLTDTTESKSPGLLKRLLLQVNEMISRVQQELSTQRRREHSEVEQCLMKHLHPPSETGQCNISSSARPRSLNITAVIHSEDGCIEECGLVLSALLGRRLSVTMLHAPMVISWPEHCTTVEVTVTTLHSARLPDISSALVLYITREPTLKTCHRVLLPANTVMISLAHTECSGMVSFPVDLPCCSPVHFMELFQACLRRLNRPSREALLAIRKGRRGVPTLHNTALEERTKRN